MYCSDLLPEIKRSGDMGLIEEFYVSNYGLVIQFVQSFGVAKKDEEDFKQLCFIAFLQAIRSYSLDSKNSFLSYWRRCLLHEYFCFKLEMQYPFCIKRADYKKFNSDKSACVEDVFGCYSEKTYTELDEAFSVVEQKTVHTLVWSVCSDYTSLDELQVLRLHFEEDLGLPLISERMGLPYPRVRSIYYRSIRRLRSVGVLKEIAKDYYCIGVR